MQRVSLESLTGGQLSVKGKVLNFGCGPKLVKGAVNADPFVRGEGIVSTSLYEWDFPDDSFDMVVSFRVFEHVRYPQRIADLVYRVLKPDGISWSSIAFCEHFHQYPKHYFNVAPDGARALFHRLENVEVFTCPGTPPSELCYVIKHWRNAARISGSKELTKALNVVLRIAAKSNKRIRASKEAMAALYNGAPGLVVRGVKPHE